MSDYDTDILVWSERQASLLRRLAQGERVNDQVDWENIVEEVESVGSEQLHAVQSLLVQAMAHRLKAIGWPDARDVQTSLADARGFCGDAADRFAPSMRQRIDMDRLYRRAVSRLPAIMDGKPPAALPETCPWTLQALLAAGDSAPLTR